MEEPEGSKAEGFLRIHLPYIIASSAAFITGFTLGIVTPPEAAASHVREISERLLPLAEYVRSGGLLGVIIVFLNNWITALLTFMLNLLSPLVLGYNGWVLGIFGSYMISQGMILKYILGVAPHGVLEIPGLILAGASGLRFGVLLARKLTGKIRGVEYSIGRPLESSMKLLAVSAALLLVAALLEVYITPHLIGYEG